MGNLRMAREKAVLLFGGVEGCGKDHNPALKKVSSKIKKFSPRSNVPPIDLARNCVNVARRCVSCKKSKIGEVLVKPACYTCEGVLLDGLSDQMTRATSLMRKREAPDR